MKNQFASYEIALKLKELGFDEKCFCTYHNAELSRNPSHKMDATPIQGIPYTWKNSKVHNSVICAPLWEQVIDWFRDKYRYDIQIVYRYSDTDKVEGINSVYYDINIYHLSGGDAWKTYKFNQYSDDYYKTREQAILKAIELINK